MVAISYQQLSAMGDANLRGRLFEAYIAQILRDEHIEVAQDTAPADGRQVDLDAVIGDHRYLIEVKWRRGKLGKPAVAEVANRLAGCAPGTVGVLISASGFAGTVIGYVRSHPHTPVLLVTGAEIHAAEQRREVRDLLERKRHQFLSYRRVEDAARPRLSDAPAGDYPEPSHLYLTNDGTRTPMFELSGNFGPSVFALDLPDLDSLPGNSVTLEGGLPSTDHSGLQAVIDQLAVHGWVTAEGVWRIAQQGVTWNGFGMRPMLDALADPDTRYRHQRMHHSETLTYVDRALGGTYALTATVARNGIDRVSTVTLTFLLPGIPLDLDPLHTLARALGGFPSQGFRPLARPTRTMTFLRPHHVCGRGAMARIILADSPLTDDEDDWVVGIVVPTPSALVRHRRATDLVDFSRESEAAITSLGQWHLVEDDPVHVLTHVETLWVGDTRVLRVRGDWKDDDSEPKRTVTLGQAVADVAARLRYRRHRVIRVG